MLCGGKCKDGGELLAQAMLSLSGGLHEGPGFPLTGRFFVRFKDVGGGDRGCLDNEERDERADGRQMCTLMETENEMPEWKRQQFTYNSMEGEGEAGEAPASAIQASIYSSPWR